MPIIGSINCNTFGNWVNYAKHFQDAGCDALEMNLLYLPFNVNTSHDDVQRLFTDTIQSLRRIISIPLIIKVGSYFTDLAKFMQQLSDDFGDDAGARDALAGLSERRACTLREDKRVGTQHAVAGRERRRNSQKE